MLKMHLNVLNRQFNGIQLYLHYINSTDIVQEESDEIFSFYLTR